MSDCAACDCIPTDIRRCYLTEQPEPIPLYFGTNAPTPGNRANVGGGAGAVLVSDTVVGGRLRKEYELPAPWGGIPGLSGKVTLHSTGPNNGGAFQANSQALSIGGPRCGTAVIEWSRPVALGNFPLSDFDVIFSQSNGEMVARIDPPYVKVGPGGGPVPWTNTGNLTATNPNNTVADANWSNAPKLGGVMPGCLGGVWSYAEENTGPVSSTTTNNFGALYFGWRTVRQMSWSIELPDGLGVGFPWVSVLSETPWRQATLQRCPGATPETQWIDSSTGVAITAAQVDSLTDCEDI